MAPKMDFICSDCRREDWRDLVKRPVDPNFPRTAPITRHDSRGRFVRILKCQVELKSSRCRCCQILSTMSNDLRTFKFDVRQLETTTLGIQALLRPSNLDQGNLALLRTAIQSKEIKGRYAQGRRFIALLGPGRTSGTLKVPSKIDDYAWIRKSILDCTQHHALCRGLGPHIMPGLRLINCRATTRLPSIIAAPESCQYAALSYVWGDNSIKLEASTVIKDAMKVTTSLGLDFLWVDQCCLPQSGPEKHQQIMRMNEVYSGAYVTIIAAAGETAADGLPGIGTVPRVAQMETQVDGCTFLELPSILDAVRGSKWFSRAWTFQEALLSTRCLVFTNRGVLYHCRDLYVEEPLQQLVPNNTTAALDNREPDLKQDLSGLFTSNENLIDDLKHRVRQYTQRRLTFSADSLNACLGIFAEYERQQRSQVAASSRRPTMSISPSHLWGLPFDHDDVLLLAWYHPVPPKSRRPNFPSWSWCGWEGGIEFTKWASSARFQSQIPEYAPVSIELPGRSAQSFEYGSKCLYLTGPVVPLKFASQDDSKKEKKRISEGVRGLDHQSAFELFPGTFSIIRTKMSMEVEAKDETFGLILFVASLVNPAVTKPRCYFSDIVILKKCGQNFSRIGYMSVDDVWDCKHINTKGASVNKEIFSSGGRLNFGREIVRRRICLE